MSMSDKVAAFLARNQKQNRAANQASANTTTITGIAAADSENGSVAVIIPGADVIQPEDADGVQHGDNTVTVPIIGTAQEGDEITILGVGNGVADTPIVVGGAGSGDRVMKIATDAQDAIDATNQHFYDDANGIHVVTEDGDPTTGPNLLANSLGILLRNGIYIMSAQTPNGFQIYDGLGNNVTNILANFGTTIVLGKDGEKQIVLDSDGYEALNENGNTFFHVGYSDQAIDDTGQYQYLPYMFFGEDGSVVARGVGGFSAALGSGCEAAGFASFASGLDNRASGHCAAALGKGNEATGIYQLICGLYADTSDNDIIFAVGDGGEYLPPHAPGIVRKNAFEVKTGGELSTMNGRVYAATVLYDNPNGLFTGAINLSDSVTSYDYIEVLYRDADGVCGSVKIDSPAVGTLFNCSTQNIYNGGAGIAIKARTFKVTNATKIDCYNNNGWWSGQYLYDGSNSVGSADFIGVTKILGYR